MSSHNQYLLPPPHELSQEEVQRLNIGTHLLVFLATSNDGGKPYHYFQRTTFLRIEGETVYMWKRWRTMRYYRTMMFAGVVELNFGQLGFGRDRYRQAGRYSLVLREHFDSLPRPLYDVDGRMGLNARVGYWFSK